MEAVGNSEGEADETVRKISSPYLYSKNIRLQRISLAAFVILVSGIKEGRMIRNGRQRHP